MGAQPLAMSWIASLIVSGTPPATFVEVPKLERMSLLTTPLWVRTSGPFEPSPGNGPAVSSGITAQSAPVVPPVVAPAAAEEGELDEAAEVGDAAEPTVQPATTKIPAATPP